jgi:hypothetical protein
MGRTDSPSQRRNKPPSDPVARFTSSHWGIPPTAVYDIDDPDLPDELVMMGHLREIQLVDADGDKLRMDWFPKKGCILAFSADNREHLYLICDEKTQKRNRKLLRKKNPDGSGDYYRLTDLAKHAGGRQAKWDHAPVDVQLLGTATDVVYATDKAGDGFSEYIHALGEETGVQPYVTVDRRGRLWFAGGNYTVPDEGITD